MRFFKLLFRKLKQKNKSTKSKNSGNLLHRLRNLWKTLSGANRAKTKPRRKKTSSLPRVSGIQIKSRSEMKYIQCSNETRSDIENQPTEVSSAKRARASHVAAGRIDPTSGTDRAARSCLSTHRNPSCERNNSDRSVNRARSFRAGAASAWPRSHDQ